MADLGIARVTNEEDAANTLTRADLSDVVHRRLGLSRAESASLVERVLHHMCHDLSDRKSTRLNSSHRCISYAVFCLKKKKKKKTSYNLSKMNYTQIGCI